ncbi:hypothetical protein STRDD11_01239 [Streptococcus sp. DD11]|uniref:ATP-binding protein n=1 Tax=Streptococcus sp. DD11 TaxID=1777879 RepID=UPI0007934308|nr:HAMP domain-containing sensor histidine kinase [Streptococcus sp. DD11]KXT83900.1 hypothetical protein STRDD11_01239 [Streptococcus sp. DD11]
MEDNFNVYNYKLNGKTDFSNLESIEKNIYINASETQLDSIFLNLITNSYKSFKKPKTIKNREINIDFQLEGRVVVLTYSDNGNGLSEEIDDKNVIFEPYKTFSTDGTGMGMWILSTVISKLKGGKELISNPGDNGFSIKIELPGGVSHG